MGITRLTALAAVAATAVGTLLVLPAATASASTATLDHSTWAYTDSAAPGTSFVNPNSDLPVGARVVGGRTHVSKSYVSFDLSAYRGTDVRSATLRGTEHTVANCAAAESTQAWLTDPATKPTWNKPPAERRKLPTTSVSDYCPHDLNWDAKAAIRQALAAGQSTVTFALRLPDGQQGNPRYGRMFFSSLQVNIEVNHTPGKPTDLRVNNRPCTATATAIGGLDATLSAVTPDADAEALTVTFEWWPVAHPTQRVHISTGGYSDSTASQFLTHDSFTEGVPYALHVRSADSLVTGPWSDTCQFVPDYTPPSTKPVVSSPDYPAGTTGAGSGGTGIPGTFTFAPGGATDVAGYYYGPYDFPSTYVPAGPQGTASISYAPPAFGRQQLYVTSVDAAGNRTQPTVYDFVVATNGPAVTCTPQSGYVGQTRQCAVTAGSAGATSYAYTVDYGQETALAANPDGSASFEVTPTRTDGYPTHVVVQALLAGGTRSDATTLDLDSDLGTPVVDLPAQPVPAGTPITVVFHAKLPGSQTFTYQWDYQPPVTVPVGADGSTTVTLPRPGPGYFPLEVNSTTASGVDSGHTTNYLQIS